MPSSGSGQLLRLLNSTAETICVFVPSVIVVGCNAVRDCYFNVIMASLSDRPAMTLMNKLIMVLEAFLSPSLVLVGSGQILFCRFRCTVYND